MQRRKKMARNRINLNSTIFVLLQSQNQFSVQYPQYKQNSIHFSDFNGIITGMLIF